MDKKFQILLVLSLTVTTSWAKVAGYEYQPSEDLRLQQSTVAYTTPQEQRTYLPPELPQYTYQLQQQQQQQQQVNYAPVQESYKKEFYIFSAPDEEFEDVHAAHKVAAAVQKNVRVVFIRAPEQKGLEHAALQLAKQVSDHKTAIYVLNKQHDAGELAQRLAAYREQYVQKPEVHFVKYRTPAEAEHAQEQIQAHYNLLRGSTHTSNEGAAPVLDFASRQQPSYGSAISIVPAYNVGSGVTSGGGNNGLYGAPTYSSGSSSGGVSSSALYTQPLLSTTVSEPSSYSQSLQSSEYEKAAANLAALNLLNTYKSQTQTQSSFNTHSISSSNVGSYATIGNVAGVSAGNGIAAYGASNGVDDVATANYVGLESLGLSANSVDNGAGSALEGYGVSPRTADRKHHQITETAVSKLNVRQNNGGKLTFPSDGGLTNTYLPPIKRRQL